MDKKIAIPTLILVCVVAFTIIFMNTKNKDENENDNTTKETMSVTLITKGNNEITVQDNKNIIYTIKTNGNEINAKAGDSMLLEYTGVLDKSKQYQKVSITNHEVLSVATDSSGIPNDWQDNGIFSKYYIQAYDKLKTLSLDEKIAQLFLIRFDESKANDILKKYNLGGFVFFEKDFKGKTESQVKQMMNQLQKNAKIPLLTAVDEEGGKVVRISSNSNLVSEKFKSSSELYNAGGFDLIKQDTINKSNLLHKLGLNVNLAPVVDVATDPNAYMYGRTLQQNTALTSTYAKTVIDASKGRGVSYTLKHFPGYGNNTDTHISSSTDTRTYDEILANDLPPFESGIKAGAEAVLIGHNTVTSIDNTNPASLSPSVHNLLRNNMNFTGIIITDSMDMSAVTSINDSIVKAIQAGNDLIITTDYESAINSVKQAINNGTISESMVEKLAFRVLAWKYYKGLIYENNK